MSYNTVKNLKPQPEWIFKKLGQPLSLHLKLPIGFPHHFKGQSKSLPGTPPTSALPPTAFFHVPPNMLHLTVFVLANLLISTNICTICKARFHICLSPRMSLNPFLITQHKIATDPHPTYHSFNFSIAIINTWQTIY